MPNRNGEKCINMWMYMQMQHISLVMNLRRLMSVISKYHCHWFKLCNADHFLQNVWSDMTDVVKPS